VRGRAALDEGRVRALIKGIRLIYYEHGRAKKKKENNSQQPIYVPRVGRTPVSPVIQGASNTSGWSDLL
jgi:hypothetical protein